MSEEEKLPYAHPEVWDLQDKWSGLAPMERSQQLRQLLEAKIDTKGENHVARVSASDM